MMVSSWLHFLCWAIKAVCFYIKKALGSWRPILNLSISCARYIILKEVYLLFLMHPYSGYFLWFMAFGKVFQFLALFLGLHGSADLHAGLGSGSEFSPQSWIRLRPDLHDWLIQASS